MQLNIASDSALGGQGTAGDYFALLKPRVMSLVIFTAFVGIVAAPGTLHPLLALVALLAIAVGAGASGALNMWYDADIDAKMKRTRSRPVPRGAILPGEALGFGASLAVGSVIALGLMVNLVAASLAGFHDFLLCRDLHHVAETLDAAEHCDRWCRRRTSSDDRLGCGDGHNRSGLNFTFPDYLHVDAPAFLGTGAVHRK